MFRINIRTAGFATLIAGLLAVPGVVWAQTVSFPVSGTCFSVIIDEGDQSFDEEGILHIRNLVRDDLCFGIFNFIQTSTINLNVDPAGDGDATGKTVAHTKIQSPEICEALGAPTPCSGTCKFNSSAEISGFWVTNYLVGNRCTEELQGLQFRILNGSQFGSLTTPYKGFAFVVGQP
jgi:hypothetical protein